MNASLATAAQRRYPTLGGAVQPSEDRGQARYERAGAILLAFEPPQAPQRREGPDREWLDLRNHLECRLRQMVNWRLSWWRHWSLLADNILPRRYHWLITPNTMNRGGPINQSIIDSTGTRAMRICAAGLKEGLTSTSRPWFKVEIDGVESSGLDSDARNWLDHVTDVIYSVMAKSNFYDSLTQLFEDLTTFGTSPMLIYEDERDVIRCYTMCAGEYYLAVSSAFRVESLYSQQVMTVSQIVQHFGIENCPDDIRGMWRQKGSSLEVERIVARAIEPNFPILDSAGQPMQPLKGSQFAWREVYWVWGASTERPLSVRGFHDEPFIAPRWAVTSNDPYGRSAGMDALPDIMSLQLLQKRKAEAIEKHVNPPLLASVDLKHQPSSSLPGKVTYVGNLSAQSGMRPVYEIQPELQHMVQDIEQTQQRIANGGFFNDLFLLMSQTTKEMTAAEVAERKQEKLQVLGPIIDRFQNEGAGPAIRRIFAIARRRGLIRPAPDSLRGAPLVVRYVSLLVQAQKAAATSAMERLAAMAGNLAGVKPEVLDNIDEDEFIREYGQLLGNRHKIFRDPRQVQQLRQQRQQQMQQQQQAAMALQGAQHAAQTAKVLSDTPVGGGNTALNLMLGSGRPL